MNKFYNDNGEIKIAPEHLTLNIVNPTKEQYKKYGYPNAKQLILTDKPEYDENTQELKESYVINEEDNIVQTWEIKEVTENANSENSVEMEVDTAETQGN